MPLNTTPQSDSMSSPHNSGMKPPMVDAIKIAIQVRDFIQGPVSDAAYSN